MPTALPPRSTVDPATTWDLTAIYPTPADFRRDQTEVADLTRDFARMYTGRLHEVPVILDALSDLENILTRANHLSSYAYFSYSVDTTDTASTAQLNTVSTVLAKTDAQLSFVDAELQACSDETLAAVAATDADHAAYIRHVKARKAQALPLAAEKAIAELGPALDAPSNIRDHTIFGDMDFGTFTAHGKEYPLSFVLYEEEYQKHPDTEIRRAAYHQFCDTLAKYQETMAAGYYNQVAKEKTMATMRGYDSVIDYLLAPQESNRTLFNRQIDLIMNELAPVMRRYVTHIKNLWGLDHIGYTDLQIDLDPEFSPKVTLDQASEYISRAIAPMGQAYHDRIMRAFPERWVDFAANAGKDSGAYADCPYGTHPYVMMSWSNTLPAIYTLVHELGHTGQMSIANEHHSILANEPSTYIVEGPSTFHELLLTHSLIETADSKRLQRFALSRLLSDTYFHNCVTHLLEAAFQREVYTLIDAGESFDAAKLNELKRGVLHKFWGDAVDLDDGRPELTWMRQSHYYMGLYSYTYSASMVVSTGAYLRVRDEGQPAIADWQKFLALGDSLPPIESAAVAGVDITTDAALKQMIAFLADTEQQIEALSAAIQ
ncbi:M3 family oligoendopeptidase [Lacticaseibacillus nasuensis]|uniref:Oligoendopeptidase F n=1 Tax=Lacticaseibacillus nasuensis JCM 17158 TaxID=1291734 RepID=A0A0R1JRD1_9LACO|nr:M3 family oligoendopeptidase [Lacticaseibacillus nasuensis]KRK70964.1 Oligoendopeptidase F [Lacticaseibacillus nasuensis JCM 17158]